MRIRTIWIRSMRILAIGIMVNATAASVMMGLDFKFPIH